MGVESWRTPFTWRDPGGILPGFRGKGISRRLEVHHPTMRNGGRPSHVSLQWKARRTGSSFWRGECLHRATRHSHTGGTYKRAMVGRLGQAVYESHAGLFRLLRDILCLAMSGSQSLAIALSLEPHTGRSAACLEVPDGCRPDGPTSDVGGARGGALAAC